MMAYLPPSEKEKEDQQQSGGGGSETVLSSPSGTIGAGGGSGGVAASQAQPGSGSGGTGFVNLQRYIGSNQPGIERMTDTTTDKIGEIGSSAQQAKQSTISEFDQAAQGARVQKDDSVLSSLQSDPTKIVNDPSKLAQFNQMKQGQYSGPQSWADTQGFQGAQQQVNKLGSTLDQTETPGGRYDLLRGLFGDQRYTAGENRLDQAFMQSDPNSQAKLGQTRDTFRPTIEGFQQGIGQSQQTAQQYQQEAQSTNQATQQALQQARAQREQQAAKSVADLNAQRAEELHRLSMAGVDTSVMGGNYSLEREIADLRNMGYSVPDLQRLISQNPGLTMDDFLAAPQQRAGQFASAGQQAGYGHAMSQDDYARMAALGQLGGFDTSQYAPSGQPLGAAVNFDAQGYSSSILEQALAQLAARQSQPEQAPLVLPPADSTMPQVGTNTSSGMQQINPLNWSAGGRSVGKRLGI